MVQKLGKTMVIILAFALVIISLTACSRIFNQNGNKRHGQKEQHKKDPPSALTQMERETDDMIRQIQKMRDQRVQMVRQQTDVSKNQDEANKPQPKQQGSNQQGQEQGQQKQGQQQGSNNQDKQQNTETIKWQDFEKNIKTLNELWNKYEPQARKDGASHSLISQFENQLNRLTGTIMAHNEEEILAAANELYQFYSQFLNLYKHQAPPEIKEVKYYVRQILIDGEAGKWEETSPLLANMEKAWQTAKSRMEKPDQELNAKIDHAIHDFSQVVRQKDIQLVKIKGEILLKNLEGVK